MKKEFIRNLPGYAEFRTVCSFEKCEDEYPGWTGKEKYIVFSQLSRRELERRFPEITKAISPYILIDDSVSDALVEYKRNEDKHHWRAVHRQSQFNSIINYANSKRYLKWNPLADIENMGIKDKRVVFCSPEEYGKFAYYAMNSPDYYYAYEVLYWCGLRQDEMFALTLDDFDLFHCYTSKLYLKTCARCL